MNRFLAAPALFRKAMILAGFVMVADQFSKWLMMVEVMQPPRVIPILPSLNLVMAWNTGVSFSMLRDSGPFLLAGLAILVSIGLFIWLMRLAEPLPAYGIGFVIGGAIGNVIDRFRFGAVFDFIDFFIGNWHWPAFNLADSAITVGVALLFFDGLFHSRDRGKNSVPPEAD